MNRRLTCFFLLIGACFVVPPVAAQPALDELEKRLGKFLPGLTKPPADAATPSEPEPGYLGLFAENPPAGRGAVVRSVTVGGPGDAAGFRVGDVIVSVNRREINNIDDLSDVLGRLNAGDKAAFDVRRAGEVTALDVTLATRPSRTAASGAPVRSDLPDLLPPTPDDATISSGRPALGIKVLPVTTETRARFGVRARSGAIVERVYSDSGADRAGLKVGNVIVAVDGRRVDQPSDLIDYIRDTREGQRIEISYYDGDRLYRHSLTVGRADETPLAANRPLPSRPSTPVPAPSTPRPRTQIFGDDRPALKALEGVLNQFANPPAAATPTAPVPAPTYPSGSPALQTQVETLQRQVEALEERVRALEAKLDAVGATAP